MKRIELKNRLRQVEKLELRNSIFRFLSEKSLLLYIISSVFVLMSLRLMPSDQSNNTVFSQSVGGHWYRGNTHSHAEFSDKNDTNDVPMIAKWYKDAGYSFLLLSEHNDHVATKQVFCHDEVAGSPDFIMLCGLELSKKRHQTALGIDRYIGDETSLQDGVKKTITAGGVPILNHPQAPL